MIVDNPSLVRFFATTRVKSTTRKHFLCWYDIMRFIIPRRCAFGLRSLTSCSESVTIRRILRHSIVLYAVTFLVVLPILCHNRTFSLYFKLRHRKEPNIMTELTEKREKAAMDAVAYFHTFNSTENSSVKAAKSGNSGSNMAGTYSIPDIAIGIITVKREVSIKEYKSFRPKYVLEVTARLMQVLEMTDASLSAHFTVFICNAQSDPAANEEATLLSKYVRLIYKVHPNREKPWTSNRHEQEKNDYGFCLREMSKFAANYTLILQDDALVHWDFIEVLMHVLKTKIEHRYERGELVKVDTSNLAYVKLYFPEKWQGFAWEYRQATELVAIAVTGGVILAGIYRRVMKRLNKTYKSTILVISICILYCLLVALAIGRQNLMLLRHITPFLNYVRSAPQCCIPAVLYNQRHIRDIVQYLESPDLKCDADSPLDVAIALFVEKQGLSSLLIEPNLVDHIGLFSTLHLGLKDPSSFFLI